jgi:hypothetical protein
MVLLRLVHIVFGVFWAGAVFFIVSFILPTARDAGPAGGPFMRRFAQSSFANALVGAGALTVLSGFVLLFYVSGQMNPGWLGSPTGIVLSIGGLAATVTLILGLAIQLPTVRRMAALARAVEAAGGQPTEAQAAELPALQARMSRIARWAAILLLVAVVTMAIARYL